MKTSVVFQIAVGLLISSLLGCVPNPSQPATQHVVYLYNGALGDHGLYDSAKEGIDAIAQQIGVETRTIGCDFDTGKYLPALQAAVEYADIVFVISYGFEDQLKSMADKHPNIRFINLASVVKNTKSTLTSVIFKEEESAYLSGVLAGLTTTNTTIQEINTDKVVGIVVGETDLPRTAIAFAFQNGVHSIDPSIQVLKKSLDGAWGDPAKGKQAAVDLFASKADVIFSVAGQAGQGVLQAAQERNLYTINGYPYQIGLEPGHLMARNTKNVGQSMIDIYQSIRAGTFQPGRTIEYGLGGNGVDIVLNADVELLPQPVTEKVMEIRQQIIDGKVKVEPYSHQDVWK